MVDFFYQRYGRILAVLICLSTPLLSLLSLGIHPVNDIETWMPESDPARVCYEEYKQLFGVEDFILVAFDKSRADAPDAELVESLCVRLERLPEVRHCWSPDRMQQIMEKFSVPPAAARERLQRLLINSDTHLEAVIVLLSDTGFRNRTQCVARVRDELKYCLLDGDRSLLAGSPMFVAELDRLGSKEANTIYFIVTLGICLGLLFWLIRDWRLTGMVFSVTLWTINATTLILHHLGVELNLLLSSIPVLVMVLTMSVCVHYLYYYREALHAGHPQPVVAAIRTAWWPTLIATLTTCIGELALSVSDIAPIRHFSYAASLGSILSMVTGLGLTPALVVACPLRGRQGEFHPDRFSKPATWIVTRSRPIAAVTLALTALSCVGLFRLRSDMNIVDYLPRNSKVRNDFQTIERDLTPVNAVEIMVRLPDDLPFVSRLQQVRQIEDRIRQHPSVVQTLSLAGFFPDPLPQDPLALLAVLKNALEQRSHTEFAAEGETVWRITARVRITDDDSWAGIAADLQRDLDGEPVSLTGMSFLVDGTKREIFNSFWQSIMIALVLITSAIMIFLRSIRNGIAAMIPNLAPLCWIYGFLGWIDWPIDIAMMLSGSIALGLSVDGTFHYMLHFRQEFRRTRSATHATRSALLDSSIPFSQATLTATAGMLGLTLSTFAPTARFGWLMIALMLAALIGDVVMLPALIRLVGTAGLGARRLPAADAPPAVPTRSQLPARSVPESLLPATPC